MKTSIFAKITQPAALYEYWKGLTKPEQVTFLFEQFERELNLEFKKKNLISEEEPNRKLEKNIKSQIDIKF